MKEISKDAYLKNLPGTIPRFKKVKKALAKVTMKEKQLQSIVEQYLDALGLAYFRIPDQVLKTLRWSAGPGIGRLVSEYFAGLPDLLLFRGKGENMFCAGLELKTEAGRLSQKQKKWQEKIGTIVTYGWDETKEFIDNWLQKTDKKLKLIDKI